MNKYVFVSVFPSNPYQYRSDTNFLSYNLSRHLSLLKEQKLTIMLTVGCLSSNQIPTTPDGAQVNKGDFFKL